MLPDIGATELMVIAAVALIVVGPKDLPILLRRVGQFVGKLRGMAAEFRASFDEMARQSELDELRKEVEAMRAANPARMVADAARNATTGDIFDDIHRDLNAAGGQLHPPMGYQYQEEATGLAATPEAASIVEDVAAPKPRKPRAPRKPKTAAE